MSLKIIQVGVGGFGRQWRYAIAQTPDVEVAALVDPNQEALQEGAKHFSVPAERCFSDPSKRWEDIEADFIIDSTGHHLHHKNAVRAFAGGKGLIVVKPMSDTLEAGKAMVDECEKRGCKMVVAQQLRYHPLILKVREIVQSGVLGKIGFVHLDWPVSRMNRYIGLHRSWRQPYPLFVECSIHHLDYLRWALGEDAVWAMGETWIPHWDDASYGAHYGYALYEMQSGIKVSYRAIRTKATEKGSWLCQWHIEGEDGYLTVQDDRVFLNGKEQVVSWGEERKISDLWLVGLNKTVLEEFIRYIRDGIEPGISGPNNLNSLYMCFGAIESGRTGKRVPLAAR